MALTKEKKEAIDNMAYEAVEEIQETIENGYSQGDDLEDILSEINMSMEEYEYFNSTH